MLQIGVAKRKNIIGIGFFWKFRVEIAGKTSCHIVGLTQPNLVQLQHQRCRRFLSIVHQTSSQSKSMIYQYAPAVSAPRKKTSQKRVKRYGSIVVYLSQRMNDRKQSICFFVTSSEVVKFENLQHSTPSTEKLMPHDLFPPSRNWSKRLKVQFVDRT